MLWGEPVANIIRRRKSIRTYSDTPIEENKKEILDKFISENIAGPFGTKSRFIFITATTQDKDALKGLITYGMIKNPTGFIIGTVLLKTRTRPETIIFHEIRLAAHRYGDCHVSF